MKDLIDYSASHNFDGVIMEVTLSGHYKHGKEEAEMFIMNLFCQLFDLEELDLQDFVTKIMYWMYNRETTRVGAISWK